MSGDTTKNKKSVLRLVPGFIRRDFWRKFIALAFAIIVWNRVAAKLDSERVLRHVPVRISVPAGYVRTDDAPFSTELTLKGSKSRLMGLSLDDIFIEVEPAAPKVGVNKIPISPDDVSPMPGVTVAAVELRSISLKLDKKMEKEVPVELVCSGMLSEDYAFKVVGLTPPSVTITGPRTLLEKIKTLRTEPVVLKKEDVKNIERMVKIRHDGRITVRPKELLAKIEIYKNRDSRTFENVPIKPYGFIPSPGFELTFKPDHVSILIEGTKRAVELATPDEMHPFVEISGLKKPGTWQLETQCWLKNKELSVKAVKPSKIEVTLKKTDF